LTGFADPAGPALHAIGGVTQEIHWYANCSKEYNIAAMRGRAKMAQFRSVAKRGEVF
jgi:hypothetical protein